jgi:ribosomal protein S17E
VHLIHQTKEDVKIISNQLLKRFYNQLTDKLQQVLKNGNTVSVIVEKEIDDKYQFRNGKHCYPQQ